MNKLVLYDNLDYTNRDVAFEGFVSNYYEKQTITKIYGNGTKPIVVQVIFGLYEFFSSHIIIHITTKKNH